MIMKPYLINSLSKLLLGGKLFETTKALVQDASGQTHLSGEDKRIAVKRDLLAVFGEISSAILNLAIELAVAWVNSQKTK